MYVSDVLAVPYLYTPLAPSKGMAIVESIDEVDDDGWHSTTVDHFDGEQLGAIIYVEADDIPDDCDELQYKVVGDKIQLQFR